MGTIRYGTLQADPRAASRPVSSDSEPQTLERGCSHGVGLPLGYKEAVRGDNEFTKNKGTEGRRRRDSYRGCVRRAMYAFICACEVPAGVSSWVRTDPQRGSSNSPVHFARVAKAICIAKRVCYGLGRCQLTEAVGAGCSVSSEGSGAGPGAAAQGTRWIWGRLARNTDQAAQCVTISQIALLWPGVQRWDTADGCWGDWLLGAKRGEETHTCAYRQSGATEGFPGRASVDCWIGAAHEQRAGSHHQGISEQERNEVGTMATGLQRKGITRLRVH